jgi:hypothetical protein
MTVRSGYPSGAVVQTHFFSTETVKVVNYGLKSRRGLPPVINGSRATTVIPVRAQQIGAFRRRFAGNEMRANTVSCPAVAIYDGHWRGDEHTST